MVNRDSYIVSRIAFRKELFYPVNLVIPSNFFSIVSFSSRPAPVPVKAGRLSGQADCRARAKKISSGLDISRRI